MKWRKLGKLFDPGSHQLPYGCQQYAQSPQALVLPDRVRIYFSTRVYETGTGKFLSHVAFVDMSRDLERTLGVAANPVLPLGELGCFDEHGIFPFSVVEDGERILAYTCGWSRRKSVSVETGTGLAISHDQGLTFTRIGPGPVMGASLHEPFLVGDAFVRKYGNLYHMWYMTGKKWVRETPSSVPERVYKLAHAVSTDGVNWSPEGRQIVEDRLHLDECQALPSVLSFNGAHHMVFCYRDVFSFRTDKSKSYRIGYACSRDLATWKRDDAALGITASASGWDADMMCYPHLFTVDGRIYLLYNGNEFGRHGFGAAVLER